VSQSRARVPTATFTEKSDGSFAKSTCCRQTGGAISHRRVVPIIGASEARFVTMTSISAESSPRKTEFTGIFAQLALYPLLRGALALGLFETVFYLSYRYGVSFGTLNASPFWFPDSVLLCALLVVRPRWWWLILLATIPAGRRGGRLR
jgi:hypothetical protein